MPFIVTTKTPCPACTYGPNAGGEHRPDSVSRRAVATLEEARETAREACLYAPGSVDEIAQAIRDVFALPESGGTVGPLPDGTIIEVESAAWTGLVSEAEYPTSLDQLPFAAHVAMSAEEEDDRAQALVIAAFNAKQAA